MHGINLYHAVVPKIQKRLSGTRRKIVAVIKVGFKCFLNQDRLLVSVGGRHTCSCIPPYGRLFHADSEYGDRVGVLL